ncbi:Rieske (2Fe-2S) protein [Altererythrobacter arenosus]|uniref:Rieske (2Fe-2S) protein n=1 Tax=Altererythrobacter arenosus TaxID=3032592 RepID=A0ABY8FUG5_9SPHN|nr:Rieske (2Fe-2S) protein [Altererythrobacter sp. CAU 1644]WFL77735.1 Rieske (2Fe-2S) protein [Altererythrobacter sp. CAU 1644]
MEKTLHTPARSRVELPENNPVERLGELMPAEGEKGLFSESWFPVCLSSEVGPGEIRGENFLDGKIVIFRGEDGIVRAMSAYCPHLGADLSIGTVEGNHIECAFHRWQFDTDGGCAKTFIGDPAPKRARLFKFPTQEAYGVVWVFNGNTPHWDIPTFQVPDDKIVYRTYRMPSHFACDPWVFAANTPDMQHFKAVHQIQFSSEDPHADVDWSDWGFRYKLIAGHQNNVPIEWTLGILGTSLFWQEGPYGDFWMGGMVGFGLPEVGKHQPFAVMALEDSGDQAINSERFDIAQMLMERTLGEDSEILNTIHYRPGALTRGDTTLSRYLKFVKDYPRSHPSAPFIN